MYIFYRLCRKTAAAPYKSVATPTPDDMQYNPEVPCVRSNIKLEYREDRGRLLIANEDIKPGIILDLEIMDIIRIKLYLQKWAYFMMLLQVKNNTFYS